MAKVAKKSAPPARIEKKLATKDVIAAFDDHRGVANALGLSIQAIHHWGKFVPTARVYELLELKPALRAKVIERPVRYKVVAVQRYVRA